MQVISLWAILPKNRVDILLWSGYQGNIASRLTKGQSLTPREMEYGQRCNFEHICICETVLWGWHVVKIQRRDLDRKYKFGSYLHIGSVQWSRERIWSDKRSLNQIFRNLIKKGWGDYPSRGRRIIHESARSLKMKYFLKERMCSTLWSDAEMMVRRYSLASSP